MNFTWPLGDQYSCVAEVRVAGSFSVQFHHFRVDQVDLPWFSKMPRESGSSLPYEVELLR